MWFQKDYADDYSWQYLLFYRKVLCHAVDDLKRTFYSCKAAWMGIA